MSILLELKITNVSVARSTLLGCATHYRESLYVYIYVTGSAKTLHVRMQILT